MKPIHILDFMPTFAKLAHLLASMHENPAAWAAFSTWPSVYWASVHHDSAMAPGGVAQQRRLAAYSAACLLDDVERDVKLASRLGADIALTTAELTGVVKANNQRGLLADAANPAFSAARALHRSPTRCLKVPMVVLRDSTYRPDLIKLKYPASCIVCHRPIQVGEIAQWRRLVGASHSSCSWPLFDAPRFPITLPATAS